MAKPQRKEMASAKQMDTWMVMAKNGVKHKHRGVYSFEERTNIKLRDLKNRMFIDIVDINNWMIRECTYKADGVYDYKDKDWRPCPVGTEWGGWDGSAFFKQTVRMPAHFKGHKVSLMLYCGGDSLLSINGEPFHGLDPFRNITTLTLNAKGDEVYDMLIEAYQTWHVREDKMNMLEISAITAIDTDIEKVYWDYMTVMATLAIPEIDASLKDFAIDIMEEAIAYIDPHAESDEEFKKKALAGAAFLRKEFFDSQKYRKSGKLHLAGHSHIDLVFLWDYKEYLRKVGRTHATALRLMEEFDYFYFSQSQATTYKEIKRLHPKMYEQIKQRVAEGRWEPLGAMWVEPDSNLPSGESFVRQIMFGTRFFQKEFGITPKTCWMPDCFGNAATLPMILNKAGVEFFMTNKMSVWNDTNPWKINEFWWEAPDGSRVFAVVPPTHFVGTADPDHINIHWRRLLDNNKDNAGESLYTFGWGDGGGGVDADMLQYIKRYIDHDGFSPGIPNAQCSKVEPALASIKKAALAQNKVTVWKDELYLEAHRGVHTTKAKLKKLNRYCEYLYRDAEMYSSIASTMGYTYPQERINAGWEKILTNQFHDSLPGSHIKEVYGDLLKEYDDILAIGECVRKEALAAIAKKITVTAGKGKPFLVFNSLQSAADRIVEIDAPDGSIILDDKGTSIPCQKITKLAGTQKLMFIAKQIPAVGYSTYYVATGTCTGTSAKTVSSTKLENDFFAIAFNTIGDITSIIDKKNNREVVKKGGFANQFKIYEDLCSAYEAWDITLQYLERPLPLADSKIVAGDNGPVCAWVVLEKQVHDSKIRQKIIVYKDIARIDFETEIDWVERKKLLKVGFDVDVMSKKFTSDIPFGSLERPNYRFTDADKGKFEVCAHTWIDMSQNDYGVSILNDGKYGYDVTEQTMTITLLKGPTFPDPDSDVEVHHFTYSLYPHAQTWQNAGTIEQALNLNVPTQTMAVAEQKATLGSSGSFIAVPHSNITLEAIKKAEDSNDFIVRVVDRCGNAGPTKVSFFAPVKKVTEVTLLEQDIAGSDVKANGNVIEFGLKAFEVKSFKVTI